MLDAGSGYWKIRVDRESPNLLTFNKTIGRFSSKQFYLMVHTASKHVQKTVSPVIFDIQGSENSQDDIVIWRKILAEQDNRPWKVFIKGRESDLKLI